MCSAFGKHNIYKEHFAISVTPVKTNEVLCSIFFFVCLPSIMSAFMPISKHFWMRQTGQNRRVRVSMTQLPWNRHWACNINAACFLKSYRLKWLKLKISSTNTVSCNRYNPSRKCLTFKRLKKPTLSWLKLETFISYIFKKDILCPWKLVKASKTQWLGTAWYKVLTSWDACINYTQWAVPGSLIQPQGSQTAKSMPIRTFHFLQNYLLSISELRNYQI